MMVDRHREYQPLRCVCGQWHCSAGGKGGLSAAQISRNPQQRLREAAVCSLPGSPVASARLGPNPSHQIRVRAPAFSQRKCRLVIIVTVHPVVKDADNNTVCPLHGQNVMYSVCTTSWFHPHLIWYMGLIPGSAICGAVVNIVPPHSKNALVSLWVLSGCSDFFP